MKKDNQLIKRILQAQHHDSLMKQNKKFKEKLDITVNDMQLNKNPHNMKKAFIHHFLKFPF